MRALIKHYLVKFGNDEYLVESRTEREAIEIVTGTLFDISKAGISDVVRVGTENILRKEPS